MRRCPTDPRGHGIGGRSRTATLRKCKLQGTSESLDGLPALGPIYPGPTFPRAIDLAVTAVTDPASPGDLGAFRKPSGVGSPELETPNGIATGRTPTREGTVPAEIKTLRCAPKTTNFAFDPAVQLRPPTNSTLRAIQTPQRSRFREQLPFLTRVIGFHERRVSSERTFHILEFPVPDLVR